jgi:hypothetical protein
MKPRFVAILNYVMLAAFLVCVVLQFNDPDAWAWMVFYGLAAVACLLAGLGRLHWGLPLGVGVIGVVWGGVIAFRIRGVSWSDLSSTLSMKTLEIEEAREAGGLLLAAVWMLVLVLAMSRGGKRAPG